MGTIRIKVNLKQPKCVCGGGEEGCRRNSDRPAVGRKGSGLEHFLEGSSGFGLVS